jgi:alpha-N-arabinofuranosidase
MWCLGNEMDGPWQLGYSTAEAYAQLAATTAAAMRQIDPDLELVVCGSSGAHMPTFGEWERVVLEKTYDSIDFISCHAYYEPEGDDYASFLASAVNMDRFIDAVVATADHVKLTRRSDKTINISFDEWNVWYLSRYKDVDRITDAGTWPVAPRILEDSYSVLDAVVFGSLLISLIRHADRVTAASLAQLVNVIAPIMTEPGGPAWRQTTFYPFSLTIVDAVATHDDGGTTIFAVNRSMTEAVTLEVDTGALGSLTAAKATSLFDDDIHAANTLGSPDRVVPRVNETVHLGKGKVTITLPPVSWSALTLE